MILSKTKHTYSLRSLAQLKLRSSSRTRSSTFRNVKHKSMKKKPKTIKLTVSTQNRTEEKADEPLRPHLENSKKKENKPENSAASDSQAHQKNLSDCQASHKNFASSDCQATQNNFDPSECQAIQRKLSTELEPEVVALINKHVKLGQAANNCYVDQELMDHHVDSRIKINETDKNETELELPDFGGNTTYKDDSLLDDCLCSSNVFKDTELSRCDRYEQRKTYNFKIPAAPDPSTLTDQDLRSPVPNVLLPTFKGLTPYLSFLEVKQVAPATPVPSYLNGLLMTPTICCTTSPAAKMTPLSANIPTPLLQNICTPTVFEALEASGCEQNVPDILQLIDEPEATGDLSVTSSSESSSSSDGNQSEEDPFKIDPYGKSEPIRRLHSMGRHYKRMPDKFDEVLKDHNKKRAKELKARRKTMYLQNPQVPASSIKRRLRQKTPRTKINPANAETEENVLPWTEE